jgi:hypothetical protein
MPEGPLKLVPPAPARTVTAQASAKGANGPIIQKDTTGTVQYLRAPLFPPAPKTVAQADPKPMPAPVCHAALPTSKPATSPVASPAPVVSAPIVQASARTEVVPPVVPMPSGYVHSTAPANLPPGEDRIISVTETTTLTPTRVQSDVVTPVPPPSRPVVSRPALVTTPEPVVVQSGPTLPAQPKGDRPAAPVRQVAVAPSAPVLVQPPPPTDFRESWGKPVHQNTSTSVAGGLPHAVDQGHDPLLNEPQKYSTDTSATKVASVPTPASAAADLSGPPMPDEAKPKPQKRWRLFGNLGRRVPATREDAATTQQTASAAPTPATKIVPLAAPAPVLPARAVAVMPPARPASQPVKMEQAATAAATTQPTADGNPTPMGVGSVLAARGGVTGPVQYVPVPVVTLPDTTRPPEAQLPEPPRPLIPEAPHPNGPVQASGPSDGSNSMLVNAFTPESETDQQANAGPFGHGYPMNGYGPMPRPGYGRPAMPVMPSGPVASLGYRPDMVSPVPSMYGNGNAMGMRSGNMAAAGPYSQRMPMQGNPAAMGSGGQGVMPASYQAGAAPAGTRAMPANQSLGSLQPQSVPQLLTMLQDSLYPSHREWAADSLASCDWRSHPHVVQALVLAAGKDPAATVRAGCVRALARMNVNTMPVISAVQALRTDTDPRVQYEVERALGTFSPRGAEK